MIFYISVPFLSLLLIVTQMTISDIIFFGKIGVEISLILVIYAGFRLDVMKGGILSFIIGFVHDCLGCSVSGLYTFIYVLVFLMALLASSRVSPDKSSFIVIFTLICALFEGMIIAIFNPLLHGGNISVNALQVYLLQSLIVSGLSPVLFKIFHQIEEVLIHEDKQTA